MNTDNIWLDDEILKACERYTSTLKSEKKAIKSKKVINPKRKYTFKDGNMAFTSQVKDYQERMRLSTGCEISYSQAKIKVRQIIASEKRRNDMITQNRYNYSKIIQDTKSKDPYEDFDSDSETVALEN